MLASQYKRLFLWMVAAMCFAVVFSWAVISNSADGAPQSNPPFDLKGLLLVLVPTLWATVGPMIIAAITKLINSTVGTYVPQSMQIILSSILGAAAAAMGDGGATIAATAISGAASQVYAGAQPSTFLTEKRL